jgi:O-methyltransferase involved in polyketide biosynthesis
MDNIDTAVAHPARVYDYWLGGTASFAADRVAAEQTAAASPGIVLAARASRAFLGRAVRLLAGAGIRQFLDIGAGLPTAGSTHEVAQAITPGARVVYADNDPLVLAHAQQLLRGSPAGACAYIFADLRDPDGIRLQAAATLDAGEPVAVLLLGVLQYVPDADGPHTIVSRLMAEAPPGSYLVISHPASDLGEPAPLAAAELTERITVTPRDEGGIRHFFDGLELVEPGIVPVTRWRPEPSAAEPPAVPLWCGVARKA